MSANTQAQDAPENNVIRDPNAIKIKRALVSASDKNGLEEFVRKLEAFGVEILSTGGTAKMLKEAGIQVKDVSEHTGFPEIMDGRVKTLHPTIHGGILAKRSDDAHKKAMEENDITDIDMVVVNLYPFVETVQGGKDFDECIENIDIGGPAMIRAAAKNHQFVSIVTDPEDYERVLGDMESHDGAVTYRTRKQLAATAFALTATYDSNIASWFVEQMDEKFGYPRRISFSGNLKQTLRYGENPHQKGFFFGNLEELFEKLHGKELSYNNLLDVDAAVNLMNEFKGEKIDDISRLFSIEKISYF